MVLFIDATECQYLPINSDLCKLRVNCLVVLWLLSDLVFGV